MVHRALLLLSVLSCTLVAASFALFAHDQIAGAAQRQTLAAAGSPVALETRAPSGHRTAQPRRFIDASAHTLTAPFAGLVPSDDPWVGHGIPCVIALVVYGLGGSTLARAAQGRRRPAQR